MERSNHKGYINRNPTFFMTFTRLDLYDTLRSIADTAEKGDADGLCDYNLRYSKMWRDVYSRPLSDLDMRYEECRDLLVHIVGGLIIDRSHVPGLVSALRSKVSSLPQPSVSIS